MSMPLPDAERDPRRWAGRTADERAERRRRQLLEAGLDLLGTQGAGAVTVRAVTRGSGLSPRYFYESFTDREDLLEAVFDDRFEALRGAVEAAMRTTGPGFDAQARASIDATTRWLEDDPRLARAMLRETLADTTLRARAELRLPELVVGVAVRALGEEEGVPPEVADLQVPVTAISGVMVALFLTWSEGSLRVSREELVEHTLAAIVALFAATRAASGPGHGGQPRA